MRLLFDESLPVRLKRSLPSHSVRTVGQMGWSGTKNGKLLALAAEHFDALITVDKNLQYQQNLKSLPVAVVVLMSMSNELEFLLPLVPELEQKLASLEACAVTLVGA
jgi:predicted nuclease of predicted toxin-antitoxin system